MPALPYYNGQIVTPPDYMGAVPAYSMPVAGSASSSSSSSTSYAAAAGYPQYHQRYQPVMDAYGYYRAAPGPASAAPPPTTASSAAVGAAYQPHAAHGYSRRHASRSQLFDYQPASSYTTSYYVPTTIPLDQLSTNDSLMNYAAPPQYHQMPPPPPQYTAYNPVAAPQQPRRHQPQAQPQAAAVTGGVSAKLDYEIDEMAKFLATMAYGVMVPNAIYEKQRAPASFAAYTKFVNQVLTATRLPRETIILSLVYLSKRWALGAVPDIKSDNDAIYRMLVVSLLLANKFHDDNTFTNKSWFEATGIAVAELTATEKSWLAHIQWSLHLNESEMKGWDRWNDCWKLFTSSHKDYSAVVAAAAAASAAVTKSPVRHGSSSLAPPTVTLTPCASPPCDDVHSSSNYNYYKPTSPGRPTYTIPKWYESAHQHVAQRAPVSQGEKFSSFFQQSFAGTQARLGDKHLHHHQSDYPTNSYYVNADNSMMTCNCSMCAFEPVKTVVAPGYHHHHAFATQGWFGSSVAAC
ncbi:hypothetical protein TRVA0_019S01398 [Trichomonascus vanleenenianus]|uniref:Clg1p n=1 Tax=Trichomonascus vanleenenianus TaxID=2268995 RepID=UPI003ECB58F2